VKPYLFTLYTLCTCFLLWLWLRRELTPARFLTFFESENSLSIRLLLATVWTFFVMVMLAHGHIDEDGAVKLMYFPEILLVAGVGKIALKSFAARPAAPTQIKAKTATVDVEGDANFSGPSNSSHPQPSE
jgi:hypothetical protein